MNKTEQLAEALRPAVAGAVSAAIERSDNTTTVGSEQAIANAAVKGAAEVIINQTNNEPWYQSTVTIGALVTLITAGYAFAWNVAHTGLPAPADFATQIGPIVGAFVTLYGRWFALRPLPIGPSA